MTNVDPAMEPIFTEMTPCPGVEILKMMPCSAGCPRTEKYMSTLGCLMQGGILINGGGGWELLKETNKRLHKWGIRNSQKRVFTLSTEDKCILRVHSNDFFSKRKHLN